VACEADADCERGESCVLDHCVLAERVKCRSSKDCAADSKCVVRLLAERKIVDETIERKLLSLVDLAQRGAAPVVDTPVNPAVQAAFTAYRNWLNEWREVARSTFTRRDHLIGLGLAFRKEGVENTAAPEA
jgi:hypothetical protein